MLFCNYFIVHLRHISYPFEKIVRKLLVKSSLVFVLVESVRLNALKFFIDDKT
ncbi:hypothetical protein HMPREF1173_01700 [Prevotella nigrescens CC14M]|uniref:Uncharacterized protein n=1 Tax=Prevotella nigrescens CC14M TaxID=1073366 RepID=V8CME4_9BACT|nr:hypothetical protein HMPREF1173_01700 [Prevotella nigrescens CC14M]